MVIKCFSQRFQLPPFGFPADCDCQYTVHLIIPKFVIVHLINTNSVPWSVDTYVCLPRGDAGLHALGRRRRQHPADRQRLEV